MDATTPPPPPEAPAEPGRVGFFRAIGKAIVDGVTQWVAYVTLAGLVALGGLFATSGPSNDEIAAWKRDVTTGLTHVEADAKFVSWRQMPTGRLDIYRDNTGIRKLVRHFAKDPSREFFFTADTLFFAFIRGADDKRAGRAPHGSGHRFSFRIEDRWFRSDTVRMFEWIGPGNAVVSPATKAFAAAERALLREADEVWKFATGPRPVYNDSLARLHPPR